MATLNGTESVGAFTASGSVVNVVVPAPTSANIALLAGAIPARTPNAVANITGTTLSGANIIDGTIVRSGPSAIFTDTTDTAASIINALPSGTPLSYSWMLYVKNISAFTQTIAAGAGVTLAGDMIVPPSSLLIAEAAYTSTATITITGLGVTSIASGAPIMNTAISTVGAGLLTGAAIVGGVITRSGSTSAFTDTTDSAANIIAAIPNSTVGQSWELVLVNTTAFAETLSAGSGVTLSGLAGPVPGNASARFLVTYTASNAVTMQIDGIVYNAANGYDPSNVQTQMGGSTGTFTEEGNLSVGIISAGSNPGGTGSDYVLASYSLPASAFDKAN